MAVDIKYPGVGHCIPFRFVNGSVFKSDLTVQGIRDHIRDSIYQILSTNISVPHSDSVYPVGERVMNREFGSMINEVVFFPAQDILKVIIRSYVIDSLTKFEPRIELISSDVTSNNDGSVIISIQYKIKYTSDEDTFVFPYYIKR